MLDAKQVAPLVLVVVAVALGCARRDEETAATDLLPLLPFTETRQETGAIDFSTLLADAHLGSGWSRKPPDGMPAVPGARYLRQRVGRLFFHVTEPADRRLHLRCASLSDARRPLPAAVRVNGRYLGRASFGKEPSTVAVALPASAQRSGRNELVITARVSRPIPRPIAQHFGLRESALACESLRVEGPPPPASLPRLVNEAGGPQLVLPPGAAAEFYVPLEAGTRLALRAASPEPGADVLVERRGRAGEPTTLYRGPARDLSLGLPGGPTSDVALLRVAAANGATVRLERLALERPSRDSATSRVKRAPAATNVILYVVDTLRADRLGCYGYTRPTSPHIDALAREAVLFTDAQAQAPWTRPAVASLLTGLIPPRHGAVKLQSPIASDLPTLAEALHERGYATAAWVTNMNVSPRWGFERGFDRYEYLEEKTGSERVYQPAATLHERALAWLREQGTRPFFLYLHASDPHSPYTPSPAYRERFERRELRPARVPGLWPGEAIVAKGSAASPAEVEWIGSLYDGEIAEFDAALGELLAALRAAGVLERTLLVLVADHGEEFQDHGAFAHGRTLYREALHVPLLVRFPDGRHGGRRIESVVQQVDVFATVLDYLGAPVPEGVDGRSVLDRIEGAPGGSDLALSHTWFGRRELTAATASGWKVIIDRGGPPRSGQAGGAQVYDRTEDPGERADVAERSQHLAAYGRQVAAMAARHAVEPRRQHLETETVQKLRALGYVGD